MEEKFKKLSNLGYCIIAVKLDFRIREYLKTQFKGNCFAVVI